MNLTIKLKRAAALMFVSMVALVSYARQAVSGVVKDTNGEPLVGVSVTIKGSTKGVVTDINGNYQLPNAKPTDVLSFSYIGYDTKEVKVGTKKNLEVVLVEDDKALDEVVVIGYQTIKKKDLTGSVASINTKDLTVTPVDNVAQALQSKLPGVNIISQDGRPDASVSKGVTNEWTQLYGEALTIRAHCYFQLCIHFGDVPYGIENSVVNDYALSSRYDIYDAILADLEKVQANMFAIGQNGITAERMSRSYACALAGEIAMHAAGWQTIRTDVEGLYGDVQFEKKGKEAHGCVYARRADYKKYVEMADKFFSLALGEAQGSVKLITVDDRAGVNNAFQRHWQYIHDLKVSPESYFEAACLQNSGNSEYGYGQGRPSNGAGSNAAPCKVFAGIRILPTAYYDLYEEGDLRRDPSMVVTGSDGKGNEMLLSFDAGSKCSGGISTNKMDVNRMNPLFSTKQRMTGMNYSICHISDVMLLAAEAKAELGQTTAALALVNKIRERAFGNSAHNLSELSGDALKDAIWNERKLELLGEGDVRWDMIRSGKFHERTAAMKNLVAALRNGLRTDGYYTFSSGRTMSNYIWTKMVKLDNPLTFNADPSNPALYPGWRGVGNWSSVDAVKNVVTGTDHNLAIEGLYEYIDPASARAQALEADGYKKVAWGEGFNGAKAVSDDNYLGGWVDGEAPRYFHPIPFEVLSQSKGKVTNGYGLPQE